MANNLYFEDEALKRLEAGIEEVADAVKVTLGPKGRNVSLEQVVGSPQITKDGVTVAREVEFGDIKRVGAETVKQASIKTSEEAGDGTTTSVLLAQDLFSTARKSIVAGLHPTYIKRGMDKALKHALSFLYDFSVPVEEVEEIEKVATLASNGNEALGEIIAEAMEMVGKDGVIAVEESQSTKTYLEFSEGMQLDRGYLSREFLLEDDKDEIALEDTLVLLADKRLSDVDDVLPALEMAQRENKPLMIMAHDLEGKALQVCLYNHTQRKVKVCASKAPRIGEKRTEILENLASLTNGTVVSDQKGIDLQNTLPDEVLGGSDSVKVNRNTTTFVGGHGNDAEIQDKIRELRTKLNKSGSEHDKEFYQKQMSQMSGGVAVIRVGAHTEVELKNKKALTEDALSATQAAVQEGIVPGGGVTLLRIADYLRFLAEDDEVNLEFSTPDERAGFEIFTEALSKPFHQIMENAGIEPNQAYYRFMDVLEEAEENEDEEQSLILDARTNEVRDAMESGVIDPTLVVTNVLQNAVSVASTLATSSCLITEDDVEDIFDTDKDDDNINKS